MNFQPEISFRTIKMMGQAMSQAFVVPFNDLPRVIFHAAILSAIVAGFWLLDALKDPILASIVGIEYQPLAKVLSVAITLVVVCSYDFLTSVVDKPSLFHIISVVFGMIFMILASMLSDPHTGLDNHEKSPHRMLGWICYFAIESYGSLMVALFWSFTNSIMDLEQAKGGYGLIISIAQVGAILGSTVATTAETVGIAQLFLISAMSVFSISLLIKVYHIVYRDDDVTSQVKGRVRRVTETSDDLIEQLELAHTPTCLQRTLTVFSGFYEGLLLIVKYRYVFHILVVTCLYEIVITVLDYEFKVLGSHKTSSHSSSLLVDEGDGNRFANLLGHFGQFTNLVSLLVASVGFSFLVHRLGVKGTLMVFPTVLFVAVIVTNLVPSLWVLFTFVSLLKAILYSLHDPAMELLYMPTSEPIKFKAKAWIDVLGARLAKALGSIITNMAHGDPQKLRNISEMPIIVISVLLLVLVWITGRQFDTLVRDRIIVGDEDSPTSRLTSLSVDGDRYAGLEMRNGLKPGDVGYDGYDLHFFEAVFSDDEENNESLNSKADERNGEFNSPDAGRRRANTSKW